MQDPNAWGPPMPTLGDAVDMHAIVFGDSPEVFTLACASPVEAIAAVLRAIAAGEPLNAVRLERVHGIVPPPLPPACWCW